MSTWFQPHLLSPMLTPSPQRKEGKRVDDEIINLPPAEFGRPKQASGTWAANIRIIDPIENATIAVVPIDGNEGVFSVAVVPFSARNGELHLVVGTASDTTVSPRSCSSGYLRTYKFVDEGRGLEFMHKTECDDVPLALLAFQGRLVAGVGKSLRIYDIGKKKLLRKVENKVSLSSPPPFT